MFPSAKRTKIKNYVLGEAYDLSFAFIDSKKSHELNLHYRGKDKPANVLSFPLEKNVGEILIDKNVVTTEAETQYLFIHGLLHLKGYDHSSKMENKEQELVKLFSIANEKHHHRSGHRELRHQDCGGGSC
jgi:rRNA maturation RNase YbeY